MEIRATKRVVDKHTFNENLSPFKLYYIMKLENIRPKCECCINNVPIQEFNLSRFLGEWFEIARIENRFESGLTNTKAIYTPTGTKTARVENTGWKGAKRYTTRGRIKQPHSNELPGLLRVSFFWPFYNDYRVLLVGPLYDYALVSGKNEKYLWLLSRTPVLSAVKTRILLEEAEKRGFSTEKLHWVEQRQNIEEFS